MLLPIQKCLIRINAIFYDFKIDLSYLPQEDKLGLYVFFDEKLVDKITWPVQQLDEKNLFHTMEWAMNNHIGNILKIETQDWIDKYYPDRIKSLDRQLVNASE